MWLNRKVLAPTPGDYCSAPTEAKPLKEFPTGAASFSRYCWWHSGQILLCRAGAQGPVANDLSVTTQERLEDAQWWPTKGDSARSLYVGSEACKTCHQDIAALQETTPMYHAAARATQSEILKTSSARVSRGWIQILAVALTVRGYLLRKQRGRPQDRECSLGIWSRRDWPDLHTGERRNLH